MDDGDATDDEYTDCENKYDQILLNIWMVDDVDVWLTLCENDDVGQLMMVTCYDHDNVDGVWRWWLRDECWWRWYIVMFMTNVVMAIIMNMYYDNDGLWIVDDDYGLWLSM